MSMPENRDIGGLWCTDVLERLEGYVECALTPVDRAGVEAHLKGCDVCARFGGAYVGLVRTIREGLGAPLDETRAARLDLAVARATREP